MQVVSLSAFCWPNQVGQQMVHLSLQKGFSGVSWNLYNNWAVDTGTETSTSYNSPREIKKEGEMKPFLSYTLSELMVFVYTCSGDFQDVHHAFLKSIYYLSY